MAVDVTEFHVNVLTVHSVIVVLPVTRAIATTLSASFLILHHVTAVSAIPKFWLINEGVVHVKFINLICCHGVLPEP